LYTASAYFSYIFLANIKQNIEFKLRIFSWPVTSSVALAHEGAACIRVQCKLVPAFRPTASTEWHCFA
jgi:hypothetical protein